jgi:enediyne polyketide synthase
VIPPTAGCEEPNPLFEQAGKHLYPILQGKVCGVDKTLRVGVSAMGFGGINAHVTLESASHPSDKQIPTLKEQTLLVSNQRTEVFVLGAPDLKTLLAEITRAKEIVAPLSLGDLTDWAAHLGNKLNGLPIWRAAVVAGTPEGLVEALGAVESILQTRPPVDGALITSPQKDWCVGHNVRRTRVGFLFPGQGSQQVNMGRVLAERYAWARERVELADRCVIERGGSALSALIFRELDRASGGEEIEHWRQQLANTEIAQPAIALASLLYAHHLQGLGLKPHVVAGHSLGELTAFHQAGAFETALLKLVTLRGQAMAAKSSQSPGAMASLSCSLSETDALLSQGLGYAVIANINGPRQIVIAGKEQTVLKLMARAESQGIASRRLAVSNAFHSYLVQEAAKQMGEKAPIPDKLGELTTCLFSNLVEGPVQPGLDLKPHFSSQIVSQVDFVRLVGQAHTECDFFIEAGPGRVLTDLVHDITGTTPCFPVASKPEADRDLNVLLAYAFTNGVDIHWPALYEGRLVRPFRSADQRVFIESPCERPLKGPNPLPASKTALPRPTDLLGGILDCTESELQAYLTRRHGFLAEVIRADMRYLRETPWREQETKLTSSSAERPAPHRKQQDAIGSILIDLVSQKTGYPRESITLEIRTYAAILSRSRAGNGVWGLLRMRWRLN